MDGGLIIHVHFSIYESFWLRVADVKLIMYVIHDIQPFGFLLSNLDFFSNYLNEMSDLAKYMDSVPEMFIFKTNTIRSITSDSVSYLPTPRSVLNLRSFYIIYGQMRRYLNKEIQYNSTT